MMKVTETISDNDDVNENGVDDKDVEDNDRYINHIRHRRRRQAHLFCESQARKGRNP